MRPVWDGAGVTATIWKEPIGHLEQQDGYLEGYASIPEDAQILHVNVQQPDICVWFMTTESASRGRKMPKKFVIVPTGGVVPPDVSVAEYRNTVFMGSLVWHVFAITPF